MIYRVVVEVTLREGISDPEGATIERALPALGFTAVSAVTAGRLFRMSVEADDGEGALATGRRLAERLLANPVIEDAKVRLEQRVG